MSSKDAWGRDEHGYAPIGSYAAVGDGRGVALVALDGAVDWWAAPALDSVPALAALLDPAAGGATRLVHAGSVRDVARRYLPGTNVLETTTTTEHGVLRVTDALNSGAAGRLPWSELVRRLECTAGRVEVELELTPGTGLGAWSPWVRDTARGVVVHAGDVTMGVRVPEGTGVSTDGKVVRVSIALDAGQRSTVGFVAAHGEPLFLPDAAAVDARLDATVASWERWSEHVAWESEDRDAVVRSALALKLLVASDTGSIAAAAATSLPEMVGGEKNWDYRYAWVRDAAFTIDAMMACGLQEEVHAATAWLLAAVRRNGPGIHVMYGLDGEAASGTSTAPVPGYRGSTPVRIGNDASGQVQLGIYGDLFGTVAAWVAQGHVLDTATRRQLADLADDCADRWRRPDAGIWELASEHQYTSSKMNCWRALHLAAELAEQGHVDGPADRWRREAEVVRDWVREHCWSDTLQSYTCYAGGESLDASVLLGARFGFDTSERMSSTVDALRSHLGAGPLIYRYTGVQVEEQAFLACSWWLVEALARCGRVTEARELMDELAGVGNDVGLLSEMCTPGTGELVGNLPQALSHLAHVNAADALRQASASGTTAAVTGR